MPMSNGNAPTTTQLKELAALLPQGIPSDLTDTMASRVLRSRKRTVALINDLLRGVRPTLVDDTYQLMYEPDRSTEAIAEEAGVVVSPKLLPDTEPVSDVPQHRRYAIVRFNRAQRIADLTEKLAELCLRPANVRDACRFALHWPERLSQLHEVFIPGGIYPPRD